MKSKQNSTAQGTIEYLVILAVVVVIGLAVVAISSGFFDNAVLETQGGKQLLGSVSSNIVVREAIVDNEGTALLSLENNTSEELILTKINLDGIETPYNQLINSGSKNIFSIPNLSCVCSSGEITRTCTYEIYTMSKYGLEKKEIYEVKLECVNEAIADGEVKEPTYPINGECGSAIESAFLIAPTTNLCESGNATTVTFNEEDLNWQWTCNGINDGENSETCSAERYFGAGLEEDPFIIIDCQGLQNINLALDANYILGNDIDCSDTVNWNGGLGFQPVGDFFSPFIGDFNGNYHTINNLYINRPSQEYVGLFLRLSGSFSNTKLTDNNILGNRSVGGITGILSGSITNTSTSGKIASNNGINVGGIAGRGNGNINNCYTEGELIGNQYIGGIIGQIGTGGLINNSYSRATSGGVSAGGLVGGLFGGTVTNSYSFGYINCFINCGGLVGNLGGTGGPPAGTVNVSFYDTQTSGQSDTGKGVPKTTAQMTYDYNNENTFDAWDFDTIWAHDTTSTINNGYPYLQWQTE